MGIIICSLAGGHLRAWVTGVAKLPVILPLINQINNYFCSVKPI